MIELIQLYLIYIYIYHSIHVLGIKTSNTTFFLLLLLQVENEINFFVESLKTKMLIKWIGSGLIFVFFFFVIFLI